MFKTPKSLIVKSLFAMGVTSLIASGAIGIGPIATPKASASPGFFEYQWDPQPGYKRLKFYQSANNRLERATYFLFLRPVDREKGILKLTLNVPNYFESKLTPKKLSLCKVKIGGFTSKTKCLEKIPTIIEINKDQTIIEIFPETPIPQSKDSYALVMKIFNPRKRGMFQFQALAQSTGDVPISEYVGTWNIDIQ